MLVALILLVVAIILTVLYYKDVGGQSDGLVLAAFVGWLFFVIVLVIGIVGYCGSLGVYGKLLAYQKLELTFQDAIKKTTDAVVAVDGSKQAQQLDPKTIALLVEMGIDVANLKQSTNISERVKEWRDYQKWYSETLHSYQMWSRNWFARWFVARMPKELRAL
ncbi:hypothetical protein L6252_02800 [Candidatus Parcubacteria bacterium]|nr:hypothetical protein [Candidatus Parcubacteria bacterium]